MVVVVVVVVVCSGTSGGGGKMWREWLYTLKRPEWLEISDMIRLVHTSQD